MTKSFSNFQIVLHSLTEAQKEIFLKYLKYDIQVATGELKNDFYQTANKLIKQRDHR